MQFSTIAEAIARVGEIQPELGFTFQDMKGEETTHRFPEIERETARRAGRLQALQLDPRVYERSEWRPRDLVALVRRGAIAKHLERLPEPARRSVLSAWQRVTTFLPGALGPRDLMVPEQVVAAVGGAFRDGWVSLVALEPVPGGVMVVLDSPDTALAIEVRQHIRAQLELRFAEA